MFQNGTLPLEHELTNDDLVDEQSSSVPWTIVNKYYTADVQFVVRQPSPWVSNEDELQAPAIIFVWTNGEPYRDQVNKLSEKFSQHPFEVALAIRLPLAGPSSPVDIEDEQKIDGYLSSKGFEFVDVLDSNPSSTVSDRGGIPGETRVIDALSTIMWPSMVRKTPKRDNASNLIGAIQGRHDITLDDYDELIRLVSGGAFKSDDNHMRRELEELERWLDEDAPSSDGERATDPWSTAVTPETASPPSPSDVLESSRPTTPKVGFDDDFTSFVSASPSNFTGGINASSETSSFPFPALASTSFSPTFSFDSVSSGCSTPTFDDHPPGEATFGISYRSLGSVSDFGEMDKEISCQEPSSDSEDDDDGTPSEAEIAETSRTIFGSFPLSLSRTQERSSHILQTQTATSPTVSTGTPQGALDEEFDPEITDADPGQFDLQSVLGALRGLKEEIAGMPDKERRKAAARVALGLVYGLP
ncbi:hypothetical protein PAXRUDRAFT_12698 [Paxillus rubicundulus Ve08.2h10]|uniref:Uncharacterized protein n=1 Tax=Paxillus rubicundulus Ve08.2h10 TaxID=930991 RepID=A0A0D0E6M1_9AGAM|nr:hypothetical protein PAXRUDRAFT_12698 [Paxillus rubicundulus Ve08.2h10]